jgi:hypothetical protein
MTAMQTDNVITHTKNVRGKTVLVPSLELVRSNLDGAGRHIDANALRAKLKQQFSVQLICPVTLRRHLKALGVTSKP